MKFSAFIRLAAWTAALVAALLTTFPARADHLHGVVASGHPAATKAGLDVLKSGGNAIDAAVAVGFTLGVVDGHNSGIGGGCFLLIRLAGGEVVAIDGREMAPAAATREMFVRDGKGDTGLSQTGPLASGVPGQVAAFEYAVRKHGKRTLGELLLPAAELAEEGFKLSAAQAARIQLASGDLSKFEPSRAIYFKEGQPLEKDDWFKQPDLAATYRSIAQHGAAWFYRGPFAEAVGKWMEASGGIITASDFASYHIQVRESVTTTYRGFEIVAFPPPSSGGVHVVQMLNILEKFDLKSFDEATRMHVMAEAMKLAFADRAHWLGDPDHTEIPRALIAKEYGAALAGNIHLERAADVASHGVPPGWESDTFKKHTTHFSVADAEGNWVACTATINTTFGSKVVIPGTGVMMNNEMDDFAVQPGVPNAFGLLGAEANAVAPGKRPLSSMSPTIVLRRGEPIAALGAAGGPKIITAVLVGLVNMLDLGMTPQQAIAAPRIHHQWSPGELLVEQSVSRATRAALQHRGHQVRAVDSMAVSQIVARTPDGKGFTGATDPRAAGTAEGW